jgi:hypothetical protein
MQGDTDGSSRGKESIWPALSGWLLALCLLGVLLYITLAHMPAARLVRPICPDFRPI